MYQDQIVHVVNRTLEPLDAMYDGRPYVIPPGYKVTGEGASQKVVGAGPGGEPASIPMLAGVAKTLIAQHPVMGTQDPYSAHPDQFEIGVVESPERFPIDFVEDTEAVELLDRTLVAPERQNIEIVAQRWGRKTVKKKKRDPKTKRVIGADPRSRERFPSQPMSELNENPLAGSYGRGE